MASLTKWVTGPMGGYGETIEADETYVGGKTKNRNAKQQKRFKEKRRSAVEDKQPVVALGSGPVKMLA